MTADEPLLRLYGLGTALIEPLAKPYLQRRLRRGKEDAARLGERLGRAGRPRPAGALIWLHGASVGEALALLPLIERMVARDLRVLVTTGTVSSARILEQRLPAGVVHQFVPLDIPAYVRRFLDHWRPDIAMLAESELWPNLVVEVGRRAIPLLLVSARLSQRSFDRWRRLPKFIAAVLGRTTLCLAQTEADAARLAALGAPQVVVAGNLKFDGAAPPAEPAALAVLAEAIGGRPTWLAASLHVEEEAIVLDVHRRLSTMMPDLLTVLVPRQIERGAPIAAEAAARGLLAHRRAQGEVPGRSTQVYVGDTMGEMGLFYRAAPIVFVGKSLGGGGGQNPIEPAKLGSAILHGPHVANFAEVYRMLDSLGGAAPVADAAALGESLARLLADPAAVARMAQAARVAVVRHAGATDRIMAALDPFLARLPAQVEQA